MMLFSLVIENHLAELERLHGADLSGDSENWSTALHH